MASRIVVVGSSNTDMVLTVERIPRPGETVLGGQFMMAPGGKGANQAVAAARAGGKVAMIARVGADMFGERAVAGLVEQRVDVEHIWYDDCPSGVALIFVGHDGENCIGVGSGANSRLMPSDLHRSVTAFAEADAVLLQLEIPLETVTKAAEMASAAGALVILNPAPAQQLSNQLLEHVSILTPNETEAHLLTGIDVDDEPACEKAAVELLRRGAQSVVLTLGRRGAYVASSAFRQMVPGFTVEQVDTTAAGDTFNGALAVALAEGQLLVDAVRFANAAAALSVTQMGAQASAPSRGIIEAFLAKSGINDGIYPDSPVTSRPHLNRRSSTRSFSFPRDN